MLAQAVKIKDKQIKTVINWPELISVRDIWLFISFANFYWYFIQDFSKIVAFFTSILNTTKSSKELAPRVFGAGNNKVVGSGDARADERIVDSSKCKNKKSRKLTCIQNIGATKEPIFLTADAKKAFNYLKQAFIKDSILQYFDTKSHIWIKTNASGYAIGKVLSQLSIDWLALKLVSNLSKSDFC